MEFGNLMKWENVEMSKKNNSMYLNILSTVMFIRLNFNELHC